MIGKLSPREFLERRNAGAQLTLLDVREDWETSWLPSPPASYIFRWARSQSALGSSTRDATTVVICRSGGRSLQVARFLASQGFGSVFNLAGGILAWSRDLDPRIPQY